MRTNVPGCLLLVATAACHAVPPPPPDAGSPSLLTASRADGDPREHLQGDAVVEARGFFGVPILQKSLYWDGNGEVNNFGVGGRYLYFVGDSFAIGPGLNATWFKTNGHETFAGEFEAIGRGYLWNADSFRVYWDLAGGWQQSTHQVPEGGTQWNMTFSFGPGVEVPIGGGNNLIVGARYHHMSNALGRQNDRNPSQNEGRFFVGFGWEF